HEQKENAEESERKYRDPHDGLADSFLFYPEELIGKIGQFLALPAYLLGVGSSSAFGLIETEYPFVVAQNTPELFERFQVRNVYDIFGELRDEGVDILEIIFPFLDARHVIVKKIIFLESAHFEHVVKKVIIALSQEKTALYRREIPKVQERQGGNGDESYREDDKYLPFYGTCEPPKDRIAKKARTMPKWAACHYHHFSPDTACSWCTRSFRLKPVETVSQSHRFSYFPPFLKGGRGDFGSPMLYRSLESP